MKKKGLGIRIRLFLEVGAIIAVCLIGIAVANSRLVENVYIWNAERSMNQMAQQAEQAGDGYFYLLSEFERTKGVSIDLYDSQDNFLYEGGGNFVSGNRINIISRTENEDGSYFNIVSAEGSATQYIVFGKDFANGCHIEISTQKDPIQESAKTATSVTTLVTVSALVVALLFILGYSKRFTKPLVEMSQVTNRIAELDFSDRCDVKRNDEIGVLAHNINTVSDSLSAALTELREKNAQLLLDIEKERKIEKMRSDFISAASHELKTPIAIIRGYAEGLKMSMDDENKTANEYCDIIMNESDRMNNLVLNMLEQSLYTSGGKEPEKTEFSIDEFVESFLKTVTPIFEERGVSVGYEKTEGKTAFADKAQMTTVLSNIVLNACSHAKGEKKILIDVEELEGSFRINVFNTGSFVDEKDKDGIFTSFYRADKAHSRAEGRFGLGLAIVKSITENHGCECGFENKENGVTFWFTVLKGKSNEY